MRNGGRKANWKKCGFELDSETLKRGRGETGGKMGRKQNLRDAVRSAPRVGTFYRNVSCTAASHVRGDESENEEGK